MEKLDSFSSNQDVQDKLLKLYSDQIRNVISKYVNDLVKINTIVRFDVVSSENKFQKRVDGIELNLKNYIEKYGQNNLPENHLFNKIMFRTTEEKSIT